MRKPDKQLLKYAEVFFKLSFAIHSTGSTKLEYLDTFSWGKHVLSKKDLKLTKKQEELGIALLHHVATYTLASQIDTTLQNLYKNRFKHRRKVVRNASWIARLVRNAFAHNPFYPQWIIQPEAKNSVFEVEDIIKIKTSNLDGKFVSRHDYGGPLALLSLSEFVRIL
ncbi:MAG: hypothetical protein HY420_05285 [Candidatus Kerfeldbacteria bacterium]|nr:hypothetical protein [Candidatus Kerfeldbacteria bacterium]